MIKFKITISYFFQYYNQQFPNDKEISRIIVHPQYAPPKKYNDIAIIEIVEEILEFTKLVQPACLWTKFDTSSLGAEATLTGWGVVNTSKKIVTSSLIKDILLLD